MVGSPKSTNTKHALSAAFLNLLRTHPISEITVKDITADCGVNRNTFYYHFNNLGELVEYTVKTIVDGIIEQHPPKADSVEEAFLAAINFAQENRAAINHIYHSTNRAIFERHLWHICEYAVLAYLSSAPSQFTHLSTTEEREIFKDFLKFECFGFAIDWLNHDMPIDTEQKIKAFSSIFRHVPKNVY